MVCPICGSGSVRREGHCVRCLFKEENRAAQLALEDSRGSLASVIVTPNPYDAHTLASRLSSYGIPCRVDIKFRDVIGACQDLASPWEASVMVPADMVGLAGKVLVGDYCPT